MADPGECRCCPELMTLHDQYELILGFQYGTPSVALIYAAVNIPAKLGKEKGLMAIACRIIHSKLLTNILDISPHFLLIYTDSFPMMRFNENLSRICFHAQKLRNSVLISRKFRFCTKMRENLSARKFLLIKVIIFHFSINMNDR